MYTRILLSVILCAAFGWPARNVSAFGPLDEFHKATDRLDSARKDLSAASEQLDSAVRVENLKVTAFDEVGQALSAAKVKLNNADLTQLSLKKAYDAAERTAGETASRLTDATGKLGMIESDLLNKKMLAFDFSMPMAFDFNPITGGHFFQLDVGNGVKIGPDQLEHVLEGDFKMPEFDPFQGVAFAVGLRIKKEGDYAGYRRNAIAGATDSDVYVSSARLVEFAGPERVSEGGAKALLGGAGAKDVALETLHMLEVEYEDIVVWLENQAVSDPTSIAFAVLEAMVSQKAHPIGGIELKLGAVEYKYKLEAPGVTELPKQVTSRLGITEATIATVTANHVAFTIAVKRASGETSALARGKARIVSRSQLDVPSFSDAIAKHGGPTIRRLAQLSGLPEAGADELKSDFMKTLYSAFHFDDSALAQIQTAMAPDVDLAKSSIAAILSSRMKAVALGNESSVEILSLSVNIISGSIQARLRIRNRHSWGTIGEALAKVRDRLKDSGTPIDFVLSDELLNPLAAARTAQREADKANQAAIGLVESAQNSWKDAENKWRAANNEVGVVSSRLQDVANARAEAAKAVATAKGTVEGCKRSIEEAEKVVKHWKEVIENPLTNVPNPISNLQKVKIKNPF